MCRQAGLLQVLVEELREVRASIRRNQSVRTRFLRNVDDDWALSQRFGTGRLQAGADLFVFGKACGPILLLPACEGETARARDRLRCGSVRTTWLERRLLSSSRGGGLSSRTR